MITTLCPLALSSDSDKGLIFQGLLFSTITVLARAQSRKQASRQASRQARRRVARTSRQQSQKAGVPTGGWTVGRGQTGRQRGRKVIGSGGGQEECSERRGE